MLPHDEAMLLSYLNMKLRDGDGSLEELAEDVDEDAHELEARMDALGYRYDGALNRFLPK